MRLFNTAIVSHVRVLHRKAKAPLDQMLYSTRNLWIDLGIRDVNRMKNQPKTVPQVAGAPADRKSGSHRNGRSDSGARWTKMPPRQRQIQRYLETRQCGLSSELANHLQRRREVERGTDNGQLAYSTQDNVGNEGSVNLGTHKGRNPRTPKGSVGNKPNVMKAPAMFLLVAPSTPTRVVSSIRGLYNVSGQWLLW